MIDQWAELPLWTLTEERREAVDPEDLGDRVVHYSIPSIDATGTGQVEESDTIKSAKLRLHGGEVLISKLNPRKSRVVRVRPSDLPMVSSTEFVGLRTNQSLDSRFLAYELQSESVRQDLDSMVQSVTRSHQRVSPHDITRLIIPVPHMDEQHRVANFLDAETARIDSISSAHRQQISLLATRHQSWLSELSSRFVEKYGSVRLRHVLLGIEQGWSPQCEERLADEHEWGVVKAGCVNGGVFDPLQHKRLPSSMEPRLEYKLRPGDLLMSRASGSTDLIGSIGIVPELSRNLLLCDKVYRLAVDHTRARSAFIAHMLRTHAVREHIKLGISGAAGMANNLPTSVVKDCVLPDAPLTEQKSTIIELSHMEDVVDRARSALNRQIDLLAERRQALITAAVTGQIDVSTASGRGIDPT